MTSSPSTASARRRPSTRRRERQARALAPNTFAATPVGSGTGYGEIWGVAFWKGKVYGFTNGGQFVLIDPTTGNAMMVTQTPGINVVGRRGHDARARAAVAQFAGPLQEDLAGRLLRLEELVRCADIGGREHLADVRLEVHLLDVVIDFVSFSTHVGSCEHVQRVEREDAGVRIEQLEHADPRHAERGESRCGRSCACRL